MELEPKPTPPDTIKKYSVEKIDNLKKSIFALRMRLFSSSPENSEKFEAEMTEFIDRLRSNHKNPDVPSYAMWHALGGSGINPQNEAGILHEDFTGDDSVEKFINGALEKYK